MSTSSQNPFENCTTVSPTCPVEATIYTYRPNLGANAFLLAVFALCALLQLGFGLRYKTWTFMLALVSGCVGEVIGYAGRIILHINPWNTTGFVIQIILLIISPAFIAAGIYLTLKHFTLVFGAQFSVIKPKFYTWIFIPADIFSLVPQAAGAALTSVGSTLALVQTGTYIALAGIIWQVVSLLLFALLAGLYFTRVFQNRRQLSETATTRWSSPQLRAFAAGTILAYLTLLVRCIYRIPELAGGWRNRVFLDENGFIVLEGAMMAISVLSLNILHPGYCFPEMSNPLHVRTGEQGIEKTAHNDPSTSDLEADAAVHATRSDVGDTR